MFKGGRGKGEVRPLPHARAFELLVCHHQGLCKAVTTRHQGAWVPYITCTAMTVADCQGSRQTRGVAQARAPPYAHS